MPEDKEKLEQPQEETTKETTEKATQFRQNRVKE